MARAHAYTHTHTYTYLHTITHKHLHLHTHTHTIDAHREAYFFGDCNTKIIRPWDQMRSMAVGLLHGVEYGERCP